ncbi:MAG: Ig-like domain-containing protein [Clostridia bacterium]|nr:Ig-like domain-containing protein [Clostridia bacterium]
MKIRNISLILLLLLVFSLASCNLFGREEQKQNDGVRVTGNEKIINVYLIAGQSNAVGYGMDSGNKIAKSDERFTEGFENVLYYGEQERWNGKNLDTGFEPVTLGMGVASNRSGAEIGIANAIADYGEMNAIIKCAWGATHLFPDTQYEVSIKQGTWTSPTYIKNNNVDTSKNPMIGNMYRRFEQTVADALQLLIEDGYTPVIKGVWWMQGEAEMFTLEMASAYRELFETLIYDTRNMLSELTGYDCGKVPFICGLPKWNTANSAPPTYQGMVRAAMTTVASEIDNVGCVDCIPLVQHDDWHFNAAGQQYLGEAFIALLETFEEENDSYFNERVSIDDEIKLLVDETGLEFKANLTTYDTRNKYEYGFIFVPTAELTKNNIEGNYFEALDEAFVNYKHVKAEVTCEKIDEESADIYFIGKLTDVLYEDLNTPYTAIAYIKNPEGQYMYSSRFTSASVSGIASEELYKDGADTQGAQRFVNAGINFLNGVSLENRYDEADFELIVEKTLNLGFTQSGTTHQLDVKKSTDVDYFVKYTSSNPEIVSVDENGLLFATQKGNATITVECAGKSATVDVTVGDLTMSGIVFDAVISEGEYVGDVISATNGNLSVKFSGMIKDGNLYMSFELTHGAWSPLNSSWWLNDNIEFKLNSGTSYTVIFYEGVATYSNNITYGVSKTETVNGKLVTTVELCVEGISSTHAIKVGFNGTNFSWLGALWNDNSEVADVTANGIVKR